LTFASKSGLAKEISLLIGKTENVGKTMTLFVIGSAFKYIVEPTASR